MPQYPNLPPPSDGRLILEDFRSWNLEPRFDRIIVTGATGLIGRWMLSVLNSINLSCSTRSQVTVLTRDPVGARRKLVGLAGLELDFEKLELINATIRSLRPSHVWHLSASTSISPEALITEHVQADLAVTIQILDAVESSTFHTQILYSSSGAVYGEDTESVDPLERQTPVRIRINVPQFVYRQGKLASESIFLAIANRGLATVNIARIFSVVGPLMPLTEHFAIGNFLGSAVFGRPIRLNSTGAAIRNWLYLEDLARQLLLLAAVPSSNIIDVGGYESTSIAEAARAIGELAGVPVIVGEVENPTGASMKYLPDLHELETLGPRIAIRSHKEAFSLTYEWLRSTNGI